MLLRNRLFGMGPLCMAAILSAASLTLNSGQAQSAPVVDLATVRLAETGYFQFVQKIAPGIWVLAQPKFQVQPNGNVTIIEQKDGLVLVDAGGSAGAGRRIVAIVRQLSPKPVKAIIISQWHGDKPQGLSEIIKAWPNARTISTSVTQAHLREAITMNTPGSPDAEANARYQQLLKRYIARMQTQAAAAKTLEMKQHYDDLVLMLGQWASDLDGALTITTKESFNDRIKIDDGRAPVEAIFLGRANTDGDAVVWLPKQHILVAGETVILPFPYGFESYPYDWISVLEKLRGYDFKILVPGHGAPQTDHVQIDKIITALKDVRTQVDALVAQGLSLDQVRAKVDLSADTRNLVGDDPWLDYWFNAFWIEPIVTSAYKEAKGEPIVQSLRG